MVDMILFLLQNPIKYSNCGNFSPWHVEWIKMIPQVIVKLRFKCFPLRDSIVWKITVINFHLGRWKGIVWKSAPKKEYPGKWDSMMSCPTIRIRDPRSVVYLFDQRSSIKREGNPGEVEVCGTAPAEWALLARDEATVLLRQDKRSWSEDTQTSAVPRDQLK